VTHPIPLLDDIVQVWSTCFDASCGPDDDFFELNGDSLAALEIAAALESRLGRSISVTDVLDYPRPRALAAHLAGTSRIG
jgi:phthiocerol/phenolphthiocerol synthesis type-I polyketide synthase E